MLFRILFLLSVIFFSYMCGYNTGSNIGFDLATKVERDSCERQVKQLQGGNSCPLPAKL